MTVPEAIRYAERRLLSVTDEAGTEARLMLAAISGQSPGEAAVSLRVLSDEERERLEEMILRRLSREPLQYLLGEWWFMGMRFRVSPAALIPRQDTETLCEEALRLIGERGYSSLLDICTGTGCIAVSLKKLAPHEISAEASDISPEALELAKENARLNGAEVLLRRADLFEGAGTYDIVTANPPYISDGDMTRLQEEVRFEPRLALAGGPDGLDFYRRIAQEAPAHINSGGALLLEVGAGQAEAVAALFSGRETRIINDLNGKGRVVEVDN